MPDNEVTSALLVQLSDSFREFRSEMRKAMDDLRTQFLLRSSYEGDQELLRYQIKLMRDDFASLQKEQEREATSRKQNRWLAVSGLLFPILVGLVLLVVAASIK